MTNQNSKIIIVGAGISGIRTAFELAELGHRVILVDKAPAIGGILTQLDHQFPNNHCGMCRMLPMIDRDKGPQFCLRKGVFHENIEVMISTEVTAVEGNPGSLTVSLTRKRKGVNSDTCINCGGCEAACPVDVSDGFNAGLGKRKAVYIPIPHQIPNTRTIDWDSCTLCGDCKEACPTGAINLDNDPEDLVMEEIGTVVLSTGVDLFDPSGTDLYSMASLSNVITAAAFERVMSSSGPYRGRLVRPSDGKEIKKIAWIQCVGSRNIMIDADRCSSACCMFALKEAVLATEKIGPEADTAIFYMDLRTFGRDFQRYRDRAETDTGVRLIRCRVHSIEPGEDEGDIRISYVDPSGKQTEEAFDLAVLSTGRNPEQNLPGFADHEGVIVLESAREFMDIANSVISADKAAESVSRMMARSGSGVPLQETENLQGIDVPTGRPHVQAVLCSCCNTLDSVLGWEKIEQALQQLPGNLDVARMDTVCDSNQWDEVKRMLREGPANRLIIAACNPLVYMPKLKILEQETGIPRAFMSVINLRSFADGKTDITGIAIRELEMAISRLKRHQPTESITRPVIQKALIIGGGPAGLAAALSLAERHIHVVIVESSAKIGGNLTDIQGDDMKAAVQQLVSEADHHPLIAVHLESEVKNCSGRSGQFVSRIQHASGEEEPVHHGATIIATGGRAAETATYSFGSDPRIITVFDLEKQLDESGITDKPMQTAVFIQCADSREEPRNFCSRICCPKTLKAAIKIREIDSKTDVYVFYRDIMTYGESEKLYTEARKKGVIFIPFTLDSKPVVYTKEGAVIVEGKDPILEEDMTLQPDVVALATGVMPNAVKDLLSLFGVDMTQDGFAKETDGKWRPTDSGKEGIFVCGLARNPVKADEAMAEGTAAAQRAFRILSRELLVSSRQTASVRYAICSLCERCITVCPYDARYADAELGKILVDPVACQGCGLCAAECPNSASVLTCFEEMGIMDVIETAL